MVDEIKCCCCNSSEDETFEHLFVTCSMATNLWNTFATIADVQGPFLQLNDTIHKWWNRDCSSKLKPLFKAVPSFITWQIWKTRNIISHGGKMSFFGMVMEINRNLYHLATFSYPWLHNIPNTWHLMVHFFTEYTPLIDCKMVYWRLPRLGSYKCNSDGAVKGVGGPSAGAYCIRNDEGQFIYAESFDLGVTSVLMSEAVALRRGLEYCIQHQYLPVLLETDSLMLQKVLNGIWEIPWSILMEAKRINGLRINVDARVEHILREGNTLADYLANQFFLFAGTTDIIYSCFQDLPAKGKAILHLDEAQIPNLRIKNIQNGGFNTQA